mmetsp:Transcript_3888/g.9739  ORF Transcript_3888/g.9739 Transcript_3888/m.9739 type:complete len:176 (+) Transcript_3888:42-569(+)
MVGADKEDAAKKQKGSKSLPKGVIETGRNTIKYQARVSYKPDGSKTVQRNAGTFNTPEEAALQIAAYETKLAEGMDPWDGAEIRSQHKRGQAPPMRTERRRKVGKKGSLSGSEGREHGSDGDEDATAGEAARPHYTVMPTCIRDVSCAPMSAWLLQDAGPWVALQSMDGSGELRY